MRYIKLFSLLFVFFTFAHFSVNADTVSANFSGFATASNALPRGYQKALVYTFTLEGTLEDAKISSITITNNGSVAFSSSGISKVELEYQVDNGALTPLSSMSFDANPANSCTFTSFGDIAFVEVGDKKTFYIYYTVANNATLESTANFKLTAIQDSQGNTVNIGNPPEKQFAISGIEVALDKSYTPKIVIPNQSKVPYAYLSIKPRGESFTGDFKLKIYNDGNNFDKDKTNDGINKIYFYEDNGPNIGVFEADESNGDAYIPIAGTESGDNGNIINNASTIEITGLFGTLDKGVTRNFFVVYDIGNKTSIGDGKKIFFQIKSLSVLGVASGLDVSMIGQLPVQPDDSRYAAKLGGLRLDEFVSILSPGNIGAGDNDFPVARFSLSGQEISLALSELTFANSGSIPYVTEKNQKNGVTLVSLYRDTDRDYFFNGPNNEELITAWELGTKNVHGESNLPNRVNVTGLNLFIPTTNYSSTNGDDELEKQERFFLVYSLGDDISVAPSSSSDVAANIKDARATTNYINQDVFLSGEQDTYNISIPVKYTNVAISEIESIAPAKVFELSDSVPLIAYTLESKSDLNNVAVKLLSNQNAFYDNNKGITYIKLYRDNGNNVLDANDILEGSIIKFDSTLKTNLPSVNLKANIPTRYFVVVGLGSDSQSNMNFQVDSVVSSGSSFVLPSGIFPRPQSPIQLAVIDNKVKITNVYSSANVIDNSHSYYVNIGIENNNTFSVTINEAGPVFYKDSIAGQDISYEYAVSPTFAPLSLNAGSSTTVSFQISTSKIRTAGNVIIDAFCKYYSSVITLNSTITRHKDNVGALTAASNTAFHWNTTVPLDIHYAYPAYIKIIKSLVNGVLTQVFDKSVLFHDSSLQIEFNDNGKAINGNLIKVILNGEELNHDTTSTNYFLYSETTGILTISTIGNKDGILQLKVKDTAGNQLDDFNFSFLVSNGSNADPKISNLLVYPNPYHSGAGTKLKIGFTLLSPANVTFYIVNAVGGVIWEKTVNNLNYGYNIIDYDGLVGANRSIPSGAYLLYAIAENGSDIKSKIKTKLAVW